MGRARCRGAAAGSTRGGAPEPGRVACSWVDAAHAAAASRALGALVAANAPAMKELIKLAARLATREGPRWALPNAEYTPAHASLCAQRRQRGVCARAAAASRARQQRDAGTGGRQRGGYGGAAGGAVCSAQQCGVTCCGSDCAAPHRRCGRDVAAVPPSSQLAACETRRSSGVVRCAFAHVPAYFTNQAPRCASTHRVGGCAGSVGSCTPANGKRVLLLRRSVCEQP